MCKISSKNVVTISGYIRNDDTRITAEALNLNAKCLIYALDKIEELEKQIELLKENKNEQDM